MIGIMTVVTVLTGILIVIGLALDGFIANMLPISKKSALHNMNVDSFSSTYYCLVRTASLRFDHADGLGDRRDMWLTALRSSASFDEIKDWTTTEQTAVKTYVNLLMAFAFEYVAQRNIRTVCAQYCATLGDDAKAIWTDASWETFNMIMNRLPMPFMPQIAALVELMQPVVRFSSEIPERNIPPAHLIYWCPTKTYSEMMAMRALLLAQLEGMVWLRKTQIAIKALPLPLALNSGPRIITPGVNPEWVYWYTTTPYILDTGGSDAWQHPTGNPAASSQNIATTRYYFMPPYEPHPLYSLKAVMSVYHATYNVLGCLYDNATLNNFPGLTYANDRYHFACISFASTTTTISLTQNTNLFQPLMSASPEYQTLTAMFWSQTTSYVAWQYACENALATMWSPIRGMATMAKGGSNGKKAAERKGRRRPKKMGNRREAPTSK